MMSLVCCLAERLKEQSSDLFFISVHDKGVVFVRRLKHDLSKSMKCSVQNQIITDCTGDHRVSSKGRQLTDLHFSNVSHAIAIIISC